MNYIDNEVFQNNYNIETRNFLSSISFFILYTIKQWWFYVLLFLPNIVILAIGTIFFIQNIYVGIFSGSVLIITFILGYQYIRISFKSSVFFPNNSLKKKFNQYFIIFISLLIFNFIIIIFSIIYIYFWAFIGILILEPFFETNIEILIGIKYINIIIFLRYIILITLVNYFLLILLTKFTSKSYIYYSLAASYIIFNIFFGGSIGFGYEFEKINYYNGKLYLVPIISDKNTSYVIKLFNHLLPNYYINQFSFYMFSSFYFFIDISTSSERLFKGFELFIPYFISKDWIWNQLIVMPYIFLSIFVGLMFVKQKK